MALNDILYFTAKLTREEKEPTILGLGRSISDYLTRPIPPIGSYSDFFRAFNEGSKKAHPTYFFAQARLKRGRAGISYQFNSINAPEGELKFSLFDNGENVPEDEFAFIYEVAKSYVTRRGLTILEEKLRREC